MFAHKLWQRFLSKVGRTRETPARILLVSLQKCGTHLVRRVLDAFGLTGVGGGNAPAELSSLLAVPPGRYLWSHFPPADSVQAALQRADANVKIVFSFRDPRDALVSWFHWMHPSNQRPMHDHQRYMQQVYARLTDEELVRTFIECDRFRPAEYCLLEQFRLCRSLLYHPGVLNVRFEDLIGPDGGGTAEAQRETVRSIAAYLGLSALGADAIARNVFSRKSPTFRRGQSGGFVEFFSPSQLEHFNSLHGHLLAQYGYK